MFQSTLPRGERHCSNAGKEHPHRFNPRSRAGSDLVAQAKTKGLECFNPRSRAGSDVTAMVNRFTLEVSIHAPARGATVHPSKR